MKITGLEITGFGVWSGFSLERIPSGLSVFYGPNEAGKTTVMEFIRSVLFGFSEERRRYLPPVHGGRPGGIVHLAHAGQTFRVARHHDDATRETLDIVAGDGVRQGEHLLKQLLHDLEEDIFSGVFCIGLKELQKLGVLDDTQAASMLYDLSVGGPGVSMVDVIQTLTSSRNRLISQTDGNDLLKQLLEERAAILATIEEQPRQLHVYEREVARQQELLAEVARQKDTVRQTEQGLRLLQVAGNIRDAWNRRAEAVAAIAELGDVAPVSPHVIQELDRVNEDAKRGEQHLEKVRTQWDELQSRWAEVEVDQKLLEYGPTIRGLLARAEWLQQNEQTIDALHERLREQEAKLASRPDFGDGGGSFRSYHLRELAQQLQRDLQELTKARQHVEMCQKTAESLQQRLHIELGKHNETDLLDAKQRAGERRKRLEERIHVEREREKLRGREEHLEQDCKRMREHPDVSILVGAFLWLVAVGGFVLFGGGVFLTWGYTVAALGAVLTVAPTVLRWWLDDRKRRQLEATEKDLAMVREQLVQRDQRIESLDAALPLSEKTLSEQLDEANHRCQVLDEMDRVHYDFESAKRDLDDARVAVRELEAELAKTEGDWKASLREAGLSERVRPDEIEGVISHHTLREDVQREVRRAREEIALRQRELDVTVNEIRHVASENRVETTRDDAYSQLATLAERLAEEEENRRARITLSQDRRRLHKEWRKAKQDRLALQKRRKRILRKAQARDARELLERKARYEQLQQLKHDRDSAQREISTAIGGLCPEEEVGRILSDHDASRLSQQVDEAGQSLAVEREHLDRLLEEKGKTDQRLQALRDARDEGSAVLELGIVDARIRQLIEQWRVRAVACRMLEDIRDLYEAERQPETLAIASEYLAMLTHGRWTRVWTPMGENALLVDGTDGVSRRLDHLSHGTREQLFLALRLALAESFTRRDIDLPMILDDVLVNCDARRARAAAELIQHFAARGHQVLMFTCHRHMAELFRSIGTPVRRFPQRSDGRGFLDFGEPGEIAKPRRSPRSVSRVVEKLERPARLEPATAAEPEHPAETPPMAETEVEPAVEVIASEDHTPAQEPEESPVEGDEPPMADMKSVATLDVGASADEIGDMPEDVLPESPADAVTEENDTDKDAEISATGDGLADAANESAAESAVEPPSEPGLEEEWSDPGAEPRNRRAEMDDEDLWGERFDDWDDRYEDEYHPRVRFERGHESPPRGRSDVDGRFIARDSDARFHAADEEVEDEPWFS